MAEIIGMLFLYWMAKSCLTNIFSNIFKTIFYVSDRQKSQYQLMGHFSENVKLEETPQFLKVTTHGV